MHGMTNVVKLANTQQAKAVYKNTKERPCKTKAAMWLNQKSTIERLTPKHMQVITVFRSVCCACIALF
jgi:hypothetical protein